MRQNRLPLRTLVLVGMLSALVFVLSLIEIRIPLSTDMNTRIHLGNVMCLLAGVLFGPMVGGLSAGIGSMLYDFTSPLYFSEFWITFLTKFAMGFVAGWLARRTLSKAPTLPRVLAAALAGQATYIALYLAKTAIMQHFVYGIPMSGLWVVLLQKGAVSGLNGLIAVTVCTVLAPPLTAALRAAGFNNKPRPQAG